MVSPAWVHLTQLPASAVQWCGQVQAVLLVSGLWTRITECGRRQSILKEDQTSGLDNNLPFRVANPVAAPLVLVPHEKILYCPIVNYSVDSTIAHGVPNARKCKTPGFVP